MIINVRNLSMASLILVGGCSGNASLGGGTNSASGGSSVGGASALGGQLTGSGGHTNIGGQSVNGTGGSTASTYQPCQGKPCGANCTLCAPNDATCGETAVIKYCASNGQCTPSAPQCSAASGGAAATGGTAATGGKSAATGGALATGGKPAATGGSGAGTQCGSATCGAGEYCCNASCSQCVPMNAGCITMVCTGTGGASGTGGAGSITGLHTACVNGACSALLLTPVTYYGVAGTAGPQFCSCEISCKTTACPSNMKCTSIADGPSNICVYTDSAGNVIWP